MLKKYKIQFSKSGKPIQDYVSAQKGLSKLEFLKGDFDAKTYFLELFRIINLFSPYGFRKSNWSDKG